jgi:phage repressor protein C with HTH and peptisase S24 domain
MEPALRDGDWLIAVRSRTAGPGQLVVVRDPADPGRLLVKRVVRSSPDGVEVESDARHRGHLAPRGTIRSADIVGRPVFRYAPLGRLGRVR